MRVLTQASHGVDALPDRIAPSHGGTGVQPVTLNHLDFGVPVHEAVRAA